MIRKGILASAIAAGALLAPQARASLNLGTISGVIYQLNDKAHFNARDFSLTIEQDGHQKLVFKGLKGLQDYDLNGFSSWAGSGNAGGSGGSGAGGGAFDDYQPTYTGIGGFFGTGGSTPGAFDGYKPTYTGIGNYFGSSSSAFSNYKPTFMGVGGYFGPSGGSVTSQSISAEIDSPPVPEPATWGMMIAGFGVVGMAMRRRKRATTNFA